MKAKNQVDFMKILDKTKKNEQEADVIIYKEDSQKVVKHKRLLKKQLD